MSRILKTGGVSFYGLKRSASCSKRVSLIWMKAVLGSMVQKGLFSTGTSRLVSKLKVLLLPMFAIPSTPILREVPGRPNRTFLAGAVENRYLIMF